MRVSVVLAALVAVAFVAGTVHAQNLDDQWLESPGKGGGHNGGGRFQGSGTVTVTQTTPCPSGNSCFSLTGSVNGKNGPVGLSGSGTNSNCHTNKKKTCCSSGGTITASPNGGTVDFSFGGMACSSSPTKETTKVHLMVTGGTGKYAGATGSGQATIMDDPRTGQGTISASGNIR
jgi:hypothetical protein